MKKLFLCLALLLPCGCSNAQETPQQAAAHQAAPQGGSAAGANDEWSRRRALYDFDATRPLDIEWGANKDDLAAKTMMLTYAGSRGATVPAYYIVPQGSSAQAKLPALVLLHGKDGRIEDMVPFAFLLAARGYASIIPEVVGHGARKNGVPLFNPDPVKMRDGFIQSVGDIRRSIDVLQTRPEIDANRIGLLGISMGAILGTMTAATDERLKTAVLIVGGGDWQTIERKSQERFARDRRKIGDLTPEETAVMDDIDPKNFAAHISPRPLLMISGKRDTIIPPDSARILFEAAREPKKQIWVDSGHLIPPADAALPTLSWLEENLKTAKMQPPPVVAVPAGAAFRATAPAVAMLASWMQ